MMGNGSTSHTLAPTSDSISTLTAARIRTTYSWARPRVTRCSPTSSMSNPSWRADMTTMVRQASPGLRILSPITLHSRRRCTLTAQTEASTSRSAATTTGSTRGVPPTLSWTSGRRYPTSSRALRSTPTPLTYSTWTATVSWTAWRRSSVSTQRMLTATTMVSWTGSSITSWEPTRRMRIQMTTESRTERRSGSRMRTSSASTGTSTRTC